MPEQPMFVGQVALIVVDIQGGSALPGKESGIPHALRAPRWYFAGTPAAHPGLRPGVAGPVTIASP
ncbi:MAG: hypothetical protein ABSF03_13970 [Streptosporangiaceae bacterium]